MLNYFWFRRDLRLHDNAALYHALKSGLPVQCVFIFDKQILDSLPSSDPRVTFIHDCITQLSAELSALNSSLHVYYGDPKIIWHQILSSNQGTTIFANADHEPYALDRDAAIAQSCNHFVCTFKTYKDHIIFDGTEVLKDDGNPYTVFTPFKKKWLHTLMSKSQNGQLFYLKPYPTEKYFHYLAQSTTLPIPTLEDMGFEKSTFTIPQKSPKQKIIKDYHTNRDYPSIDGTSRLGIHFRFGTISIREKALKALRLNQTYLSELIWRDFYSMILYHFPHVAKQAFRIEYTNIQWLNDAILFEKWKKGETGYPIVDAGMRELNETGHMHNRVRMIVASFLTKHLLIDWRWGEKYFAEKLLDYDLASNNGGWQWAAGCGTDAAPYFRIFSPDAQQLKFDKDRIYIKKWVKDIDTPSYPSPIVDHKHARERCLKVYKIGLGKS